MVTSRERKRLSLQRGELKRLRPAKGEEDWRIVSAPEDPNHGRTRGGGNRRAAVVIVDSDSSSNEEEQEEPDVVQEAEVEEGAVVARKKEKPSNNRVVLELDQIDKVFGQLACRDCVDPVKVTVRNICIATSIGIECMNEECGFLYHPEPPAATTIHLDRPDNFERSTDYAVNVSLEGKLPAHVPEPRFVADPNHRRKVLSGDLIKLDIACVKEKATMTWMDTTRTTKNFGYMVQSLKTKPQCEFIDAANAVLDHHFDVHTHCGA
jgi:hypothetical protein